MNESKTSRTWGLLAVVLAAALIVLGATPLWGGIRSEGVFLVDVPCSCMAGVPDEAQDPEACPADPCLQPGYLAVCDESPGQGLVVWRRVDWNKAMDTVWGPYNVENFYCMDISELLTNPEDPHLQLFNITGTHAYLDGSQATYVCEDGVLFPKDHTWQLTAPVRCWVTGGEGREKVKGFYDIKVLGPGSEIAEEFPNLQWYTMHLTLPEGPQD